MADKAVPVPDSATRGRAPAETRQLSVSGVPDSLPAAIGTKTRWDGAVKAVRRRLSHLWLLAALIALWWYGSTELLDRTTRALLPPPQAIAVAAWELIRTGDLARHLVDSLT